MPTPAAVAALPRGRGTRTPVASVTVVNWQEVGDLFYGEWTEDGERPILRPDREARIEVRTPGGDIFMYEADGFAGFGTDFERAERFAARIRAVSSIDLDAAWRFLRVEYGSSRYADEEAAGLYLAREKAEDAEAPPTFAAAA